MLLATTLAAVGTFGPLGTGSARAAGAATTSTSFAMGAIRSSTVDPATGRVYVAGDDKVVVFEPNGALRATIPDVYGAAGLFVSGSDLWAAETTAGALARIDLATETVAATYPAGMEVRDSVAVHGGLVWFTVPSSSFSSSYTGLATLDPATGQVVTRGGSFYQAFLRTIPGRADRLLVGEPGISPFSVYLLDTTGPAVAVVDDVPHGVGSNLKDLVVTADGARMVTASGAPYLFPEFSLSTMDPTGVVYPGDAYPGAIAYTPARGGVLVETSYASNRLHVAVDGRPVAAWTLPTGDVVDRGVEVAPDGSRAYAITRPARLDVFDLTPAATSVSPPQAVAGVPTTVTVTGRLLGQVTSATVGGLVAGVTVVSPTQVAVEVPTGLAAGNHAVVLGGPFGDAWTSLAVVANTGATLNGLVMTADVPAAGVTVTLRGPELPSPRTATSGPDGRFGFTGLPYGTSYSLAASDPTGTYPDVVDEGITLVPNDASMHYLDFVVQPWESPALARVTLPAGTPRDVETEPATGRVFVSIGDQVVVFDRAGALLARLNDQFGADGLAVGAGSVFVNQRTAGRIARIDPASLAVTGTWATTTATTGGLAYTGGRLLFTDGNDQWVGLAVLDPATGSVQKGSGSWYTPRMTGVEGSSSTALVYQLGISSNEVSVVDTTAFPPTRLRSSWTSGGGDWVASAAQDRVWSSSGRERRLSTLAETGVFYPVNGTSGAVAYSPALGGIVATGRTVSRQGVPAATHLLADTPATRSLALDASGDRAFLVSGRTFVVWSLRPVVNAPVWDAASNRLTVGGYGLGAATRVEVGGTTAPFTVDSADQLTVTLPPLPDGRHPVRVVTPWGASPSRWFEVATTPPGPPLGVSAVAGDQSAAVSWSPPVSEGGSPIERYEVSSIVTGAAPRLVCVTDALHCVAGGLTNGVAHTFAVRAVNAAGPGPYSEPSNTVTPEAAATVPGAPAGVTASAGTGSATVSWSAPADDGGSPVTGYEVVSSPGQATCATTGARSCTVTGLAAGTSYTFRVRAANAVGWGPLSSPSNAVTPTRVVTVPGTPTNVAGVAGKNQITVGWAAPSDDGGSPVTGYEVAGVPGPVGCTTAGATTCTVTRLSGGTPYTFQVRARNAVGWGPWSSPSAPVTPKGRR